MTESKSSIYKCIGLAIDLEFNMHIINILSSLPQQIQHRCTLWGEYAEQLSVFLATEQRLIVMIIQYARINRYGGNNKPMYYRNL